MRLIWLALGLAYLANAKGDEFLMGGHLANENSRLKTQSNTEGNTDKDYAPIEARTPLLQDRIDSELNSEENNYELSTNHEDSHRYGIPYPLMINGGRPFSLEKDPITGKIDLEKAPPVEILDYTDRYHHLNDRTEERVLNAQRSNETDKQVQIDQTRDNEHDVSPNEINPYSPNFHDFLNLPIRYSSDKYDKDPYPLISSSYANTKVQSGSNSYSISNHRPYHSTTLKDPAFYKIHSQSKYPVSSVDKNTDTTRTTTTTTTTTQKPTTTTTKTTTTTTTLPTTKLFTTTKQNPPSSTLNLLKTTTAPPITTWKPHNARPFVSFTEDYDGNPPIADVHHTNSHQLTQFENDRISKPDISTTEHEEYDGYLEYDSHDDYIQHNEPPTRKVSTTESSDISFSSQSTEKTDSPVTKLENTSTYSVSESTQTQSTAQPVLSNLQPQNSFSNSVQFQEYSPSVSKINTQDKVNYRPGVVEGHAVVQGHRPNLLADHLKLSEGTPSISGNMLPLDSTSNVVVPPDQDTVSFVLGNLQNVEDGYYVPGTAIGENPYNGASALVRPFQSQGASITVESTGNGNYESENVGSVPVSTVTIVNPQNEHNSQKLWTNSQLPQFVPNSEMEPPIMKNETPETVRDDRKPIGSNNTGYVSFPSGPGKDHVINEADGSVHEYNPALNQQFSGNNKPAPIDDISVNLTPPASNVRPPNTFHHPYPHDPSRPTLEHQRPPKPHSPNQVSMHGRPNGPHNGFPHSYNPSIPPSKRRPYHPDQKLPNILPQFRPNAKTSYGHKDENNVGTISVMSSYPTRFRQPVPSGHTHQGPSSYQPIRHMPLHSSIHQGPNTHRRTQPHPPNSHPTRRISHPSPPPPPSHLQNLKPPPPPIHSIAIPPPAPQKINNHENIPLPAALIQDSDPKKRFRYSASIARDGDNNQSDQEKKPQNTANFQKTKMPLDWDEERQAERYSEEPPQVPPKPVLFPRHQDAESPRIATLQMLQQRGKPLEEDPEIDESNISVSISEDTKDILSTPNQDDEKKQDSEVQSTAPVYVVYPVNSAVNIYSDEQKDKDDGSVVVGHHGPQRPLPPDTLLQDDAIIDRIDLGDDDEPVNPTFNPPKNRPLASDFPYPLEKPDLSLLSIVHETPLLVPSDDRKVPSTDFSESTEPEKADNSENINIIPYLQDFVPFPLRKTETISATLHRSPDIGSSTSAPIAYAFTPTVEPVHRIDSREKEDKEEIRHEGTPILLPSQQPSSSSSSAPSPQHFMAPFVASVSVEAPPKNSWSVVVVDSNQSKSNGSDKETHDQISADDTQTERNEFDPESFKPQLFGGFQPSVYDFSMDSEISTEQKASTDKKSVTAEHMPRKL